MSFKSIDSLLLPDPRFASLCGVEGGVLRLRSMTLADHYGSLAEIDLVGTVPDEVREAFDRARNLMIYAVGAHLKLTI